MTQAGYDSSDLPNRTGSGILEPMQHPLAMLAVQEFPNRSAFMPHVQDVPEEAHELLGNLREALYPRKSRNSMPQRKPVLTRELAENLAAEAARQLTEVARIDKKYGTEPDIGAVIAFSRSFSDGVIAYSYAGIRATDGYWYLTGAVGQRSFSWYELLWWLEEGIVYHFTVVSQNAFVPQVETQRGKHEAADDPVPLGEDESTYRQRHDTEPR